MRSVPELAFAAEQRTFSAFGADPRQDTSNLIPAAFADFTFQRG
jgi:hypothetical protein